MTSDKHDILAPVRQKMLDEGQHHLVQVSQDLEATFEKQGGWAGAISGATAGAAMGAHFGIVTLGPGFAMAVPLAVIAGIIGYFGGAKAGSKVKKDRD